jgi:chemotaxis protein methyltransferase CheR
MFETPLTEAVVQERIGLTARHLPNLERARRVRAAMQHAGFVDDAAFATFLRTSQGSLLDVASSLSVAETYFFRDPVQLQLFADQVLPRLLSERPPGHVLKIWSAGCATGEEPYTIAMLLDERGLLGRAHIVASDISQHALERARAGVYSGWSLRAIPALAQTRYFRSSGRNYELSPTLKAHVHFERQSLTDGEGTESRPLGSGFDVIFCRNVLIYLTPEACAQVSVRLAHSLARGGTLVTGASDPFLDLPKLWQRATSEAGIMYTRRAASAPEPASTVTPGPQTLAPHTEPRASAAPRHRKAPLQRPSSQPPRASASEERLNAVCSEYEAVRQVAKREGRARAADVCRDALRTQPLAAELYVLHASLLLELDRDAEAAVALRGLLYLDAELVLAHFLSALILRRQGERRNAARAYRRVVALCAAQPEEHPVPWAGGVSHRALSEAAANEAYALDGNPGAT